jgi:hypothetical protein
MACACTAALVPLLRCRAGFCDALLAQEAYVEVGEVVGAHGVRGELRVDASTDEPEERFKSGTK